MNSDRGDGRLVKFPYRCKECGNEFWMNFYDIMRLTDSPLMPCGHEWVYLDFKHALEESHEEE